MRICELAKLSLQLPSSLHCVFNRVALLLIIGKAITCCLLLLLPISIKENRLPIPPKRGYAVTNYALSAEKTCSTAASLRHLHNSGSLNYYIWYSIERRVAHKSNWSKITPCQLGPKLQQVKPSAAQFRPDSVPAQLQLLLRLTGQTF